MDWSAADEILAVQHSILRELTVLDEVILG
jgi:hypothetical protein